MTALMCTSSPRSSPIATSACFGLQPACVLGGETGVKHFKIEVNDGTYIIGTRTFGSMTELLTFYRTTPIFTTATSQEIYLLQPAT